MSRSLEYEPNVGQPGFAVPNFSARWLAILLILSLWAATIFGAILLPVSAIFFVLLLAQKRWLAAAGPVRSDVADGRGPWRGYDRLLHGTAKVRGMGLPGAGYFNVDPELRCERSTGGCIVNGGEYSRRRRTTGPSWD